LFSLSKDVIHRAIDRSKVRKKQADVSNKNIDAKPKDDAPEGIWGGQSAALKVANLAKTIQVVFGQQIGRNQERQAWSALPILNELRLRFPDIDSVALYQQIWHTKIECPAGGEFVWNEEFATYESTVLKSPASPRDKLLIALPLADFPITESGITFEEDGLRARTVLKRKK